jgi:hypothetical protein
MAKLRFSAPFSPARHAALAAATPGNCPMDIFPSLERRAKAASCRAQAEIEVSSGESCASGDELQSVPFPSQNAPKAVQSASVLHKAKSLLETQKKASDPFCFSSSDSDEGSTGARKQEKGRTTKYQSASAVHSKVRPHNDDERISSASNRKEFQNGGAKGDYSQSNSLQHIGQTWQGENKQDLDGRELGAISLPKTTCSVQCGDSRLSLKTFASPPKALVTVNDESPRNPPRPLFSDSATSARTGKSSFACTSPELSTETSQPAAGWEWSWVWPESDKKEEVCTFEGLIEP